MDDVNGTRYITSMNNNHPIIIFKGNFKTCHSGDLMSEYNTIKLHSSADSTLVSDKTKRIVKSNITSYSKPRTPPQSGTLHTTKQFKTKGGYYTTPTPEFLESPVNSIITSMDPGRHTPETPAIGTLPGHRDQLPKDRHALLRKKAHSFCTALTNPPAPDELLAQYFTPHPTIHEHGPSWSNTRLPFLGVPFVGPLQCLNYFSKLGETLNMEMDRSCFPDEEGFVVDVDVNGMDESSKNVQGVGVEAGKREKGGTVTVVGKGRFESVKTGRSWNEKFVHVFGDFDEDGRIGKWDIWADPLSAWVACGEEDVDGWRKGEHRS